MKKLLLLVMLAGSVLMLQAQKLEKTNIMIKGDYSLSLGNIAGLGSDGNNYYLFSPCKGVYKKGKDSYYVINKKNATSKQYFVANGKNERSLKAVMYGDNIIVLLVRDKANEKKSQIVKQTYTKTTGELKQETVIASFPKSKSDNLLFRSTMSPDKTKIGFLFMIVNEKDKVDSYYATVLNEACNVEWGSVNGLDISNKSFSVKSLAVTNSGEMYIAFFSYPEDIKKAANKKSYIDLVYLTDGLKDKMNIPLEKHEIADVKLKSLKNGDVYLAAVFTPNDQSYADEFFSLKLNGNNLTDRGSHTYKIEEKNTRVKTQQLHYYFFNDYLYHLEIKDILELDNGDIAILCEQKTSINMNGYYYYMNGSVTTFFANGNDASIIDVSVMGKTQIRLGGHNGSSIFSFVYGNTVGYVFNDDFKRHTTSAGKVKYYDWAIVLCTQESGGKEKIDVLTGTQKPADFDLRQVLFQENDKLIILTHGKKEARIETITLP